MLGGNISIDDQVNTRSLQRETSEITSLLNQFPTNTNVLVVDTNITTLLNMKQIMRQFGYQVTIETDAERALAFLTSCKHEINIVIWDFHMPEIDGLQALKKHWFKDEFTCIMSDENQTESVMKATIYGACDYVLKPVNNDVIANIWQHIVRKKIMSKPNTILPVQSDGLDQGKIDFKTVDQEQNIDKKEKRAAKRPKITWSGETQPVQSDLIQIKDLDQHNGYYKTINQDNGEQNTYKKPHMIIWAEETQLAQSDLVQTDGFNEDNIIEKSEKKVGKRGRKPRMTWTEALDKKFLEAIDLVGGVAKANPKLLHNCLEEMGIEGLTRNTVASHLQTLRSQRDKSQMLQQTQEIGCSTAYGPAQSPQGSNNVHTSISSYLMSDRAVNPIIQQNPFQNGYLTTNNNQFITNPLPRLPSLDHYLRQPEQQQYQSSPQFNYVMSNEEPAQASDIYGPDLELSYPNLPYM